MIWGKLINLVGRERAWRLSRRLYMEARGECDNTISSNGEAALARRCIAAHAGAAPFVAFDVGANLGDWTISALAAADELRRQAVVHMFEPVPGAVARLQAALGRDTRATLHQLALSDHVGEAQMQIVGESAGTNSLTAGVDQGATQLSVRLSTIDTMVEALGLDHVDLLKIDAEGHDLAILRGAENALTAGRIAIAQFEYNWRWLPSGASLWHVFEFAKKTGYRVGRVAPDGVEIYDGWSHELDRFFEANYVLVRPDMVARVGGQLTRWTASNALAAA